MILQLGYVKLLMMLWCLSLVALVVYVAGKNRQCVVCSSAACSYTTNVVCIVYSVHTVGFFACIRYCIVYSVVATVKSALGLLK